ncbi:MAG: glycosyltransferase [Alphaproteobacteria bacterium HGW-Alphaproteobacteria-5]|nr:MAG: glycosyltransferase [Alphaproteobacteria bacterium HGW-Alphaproteobacteria-5]
MRIVHTVPSVEDEASGPSYSVPSLSRAMREAGADSRVIVTGAERTGDDIGLLTFPRRSFPYRIGRSPDMYRWLAREVGSNAVDVIHNHSLWMMPNVYPGWVTRNSNVPLVVSPRGTFSRYALNRSRVVKFLFWNGLQKRAIAHAAMFHATAESEYEDIRRLGFRQPVAVIPNGIELPDPADAARPEARRHLLFLGRIHPVKGMDNLLHAWAHIEARFADWDLQIVGPGEAGHLDELRQLSQLLKLKRVKFDGPLYGADKLRAYRSADLFVLPTHSENFGMAVAEALAAGCPVITPRGAPWAGLAEHRAGWWIDIGVEPLRRTLEEAMAKEPEALAHMGASGRAWMEREFSWERIAEQMLDSYRSIVNGGAVPPWIRND